MAYQNASVYIGTPDVTSVVASGSLGDPTQIGQLPSVTFASKLGDRMKAIDLANNWAGEFIYLAIPASTTITAGLLYQWDKNYTVTVVPAGSSSKNTGVTVCVAYTSVTSSTSIQYGWFLIQGQVSVLKTAVQVTPQQQVYMSATAGRIYFTASAGKQILGARTQNTATVTSTTSTVNVYFNYSAIEGT